MDSGGSHALPACVSTSHFMLCYCKSYFFGFTNLLCSRLRGIVLESSHDVGGKTEALVTPRLDELFVLLAFSTCNLFCIFRLSRSLGLSRTNSFRVAEAHGCC